MRLLIIAALTVLISCKNTETTATVDNSKIPNNNDVVNIEFSVIKSGTNGGFTTKHNEVITSNEEFRKVWDRALLNMMDKDPLPEIDFENKMIILVAMGQQTSGGHKIEVVGVQNATDGVGITILEFKPGKKCITTDALAFPFQLIEIAKSEKQVTFITKEQFSTCE